MKNELPDIYVKLVNIFIFLSWVATTLVVVLALFSNSSTSQLVVGKIIENWSTTILPIVSISIFCGFPWFKLILTEFDICHVPRKIGFSIFSFCIALFFYEPISKAPAEGVIYNTLFCVLLILIVYPITRILNLSEANP